MIPSLIGMTLRNPVAKLFPEMIEWGDKDVPKVLHIQDRPGDTGNPRCRRKQAIEKAGTFYVF